MLLVHLVLCSVPEDHILDSLQILDDLIARFKSVLVPKDLEIARRQQLLENASRKIGKKERTKK